MVYRQCRAGNTYGSILLSLGVAALERDAVALVLEALGSNQTLDLGSLGVWLLALTLWLDFTTDDELSDLNCSNNSLALRSTHTLYHSWDRADRRRGYTNVHHLPW